MSDINNLRVHITGDDETEFIESLIPLLNENVSLTTDNDKTAQHSCNILVAGLPDKEIVASNNNLTTVIIPWAGLPRTTRILMLENPDIAVHNIHHNATPTAEMAITLMIATMKKIIPTDQKLRAGDWTVRYDGTSFPSFTGKSVLVLGFGAVGQEVSRMCSGLGMNVTAINRSGQTKDQNETEIHSIDMLDHLLPNAEVLIITLPATPQTQKLIAEKELSLLPDGATVVNIARGSIIDEAALYEALKSKRISAGIDVWYKYPDEYSRSKTNPSEFPFGELDNVVMTPHLAGHAPNIEQMRANALAVLLNAAAKNKPIPNKVDVQAGY